MKIMTLPNPPQAHASFSGGGTNTDATVDISGGKLQPSSITFDSDVSQGPGGKFTAQAKINTNLNYTDWYETDTLTTEHSTWPYTSDFHSDEFVITFNPLALSMTVEVALKDANKLVATLTDSRAVKKCTWFHFKLPSETALTGSMFPCVNDRVNDQISKHISFS